MNACGRRDSGIQHRKNSQIYAILMMSCVLWNMEVIIGRTKLNTYTTTIKNTVLYVSGA
jgi:hypothetical protein